MSFVITLYVREGIVMASDSRLTLNQQRDEDGKQVVQLAVAQSDSSQKAFLTPQSYGILTFGDADVQGVPIAGYVESFIQEELPGDIEVDAVPEKMLEYFGKLPGPPSDAVLRRWVQDRRIGAPRAARVARHGEGADGRAEESA